MRRLLLAAALPVLAGTACDAGRGAGGSPFPQGGRFVAERVARRTSTLVDAPAWATYCPSDSMLVVVVLGRAWHGGLAVRMVGPLEVPREFQVQLSAEDVGTATAAFRAAPSGTARVGVGGTVHLAVTSTVNGRFDIALPDSGSEHVAIRGTLSGIPYRVLRAAACSPI
jgi:hypothetical protein